jgi:hypothetical protein
MSWPAPNPTYVFREGPRNLEVHDHNLLAKTVLTRERNRLSETESTVSRGARQVPDRADMFERRSQTAVPSHTSTPAGHKPGALSRLPAHCQQLAAGLKASGLPIAFAHAAGTSPDRP